MKRNVIIQGDALAGLRTLPDESVDMCMTSPPYWALRDYGTNPLIWDGDPQCNHQWETTYATMHSGRGDAQKGALYKDQEPIPDKQISYASCVKCEAWKGSLGLEPTPELYITHLCDIFGEVKRVLAPHGGCWVNLGDTYAGKALCQVPSRFGIEMSKRGWFLRNRIVWHKTNAMPESCKDRFTRDFEEVYFFAKNPKYFFRQQLEDAKDGLANKRNVRSVWSIPTGACSEAHFATFPSELCQVPIDAGCPVGGVVLDPFFGTGTTGLVALKQEKDFVGIELNPEYIKMAVRRLGPFMPVIFVE